MAIFEKYQEVPLVSSRYFNQCWIEVNGTSNASVNYSMKDDFWIQEPYSLIAAFVFGCQGIAGIILNTLVIISLLRNCELRKGYLTPSIVSIALTDLIFSMPGCLGYAISLLNRDMVWPCGCPALSFVYYGLWICSALNLICIAALRVMLVRYPRKTKTREFRLACKLLPVIAWTMSFFWLFPTAIGKFGRFGLDCNLLMCRFINLNFDGSTSYPEETYEVGIIIIGASIFLLNVFTYVRITTEYRSILKDISSAEDKAKKNILEKERQVGKMVTLIIMSFFIVYFPIVILRLADPGIMTKSPNIYILTSILANSIGIIDPLVYIAFNTEYRTEVKSLVNDATSFLFSRKAYLEVQKISPNEQ